MNTSAAGRRTDRAGRREGEALAKLISVAIVGMVVDKYGEIWYNGAISDRECDNCA